MLYRDTLRFQPIVFHAYYPDIAFYVHAEPGNRALTSGLSRIDAHQAREALARPKCAVQYTDWLTE